MPRCVPRVDRLPDKNAIRPLATGTAIYTDTESSAGQELFGRSGLRYLPTLQFCS